MALQGNFQQRGPVEARAQPVYLVTGLSKAKPGEASVVRACRFAGKQGASWWVGRDWEAGQHSASGSRGTGGAWEAEAGLQQERPAHIPLKVGEL